MDFVDQTPPEILAELGRLTLAAIYLEDYTRSLIWLLAPGKGGVPDTFPIGTRITAGLGALEAVTDASVRDRTRSFLGAARVALEARNAVFHSIPVSVEPLPGATLVDGTFGQFLHHIPNSPKRSQTATPVTVAGLRPITGRLLRAREGWRDLYLAVAQDLGGTRTG